VLKPRFGSWGREVLLCRDEDEVRRRLVELETRPWFWSHGALAQELVTPLGHDLRIVVAAGRVVGAVKRVAAPGESRTNVALAGRRVPVTPAPAACELALAAAHCIGADLAGIDLLPTGPGRYCVLELNGAVDFGTEYSPAADVFGAVLDALARAVGDEAEARAALPEAPATAAL
jgi:glutathione synthase/RimK-type ligase-like ATP-grasp enzyme